MANPTFKISRYQTLKESFKGMSYPLAYHSHVLGFGSILQSMCAEAGASYSLLLDGSIRSDGLANTAKLIRHFADKYRQTDAKLFSQQADVWLNNSGPLSVDKGQSRYTAIIPRMREILRRDAYWNVVAKVHPTLFRLAIIASSRECGGQTVSYSAAGSGENRAFGAGQIMLKIHSAKLNFSGKHWNSIGDPEVGITRMPVADAIRGLIDSQLRAYWGVASHDLITGEQFILSLLLPQTACMFGLLVKVASYDQANNSLSKRSNRSYRPEDYQCKIWQSEKSLTVPDALFLPMGIAYWSAGNLQAVYDELGRYPVTVADLMASPRVLKIGEGPSVRDSLIHGDRYITSGLTQFVG